MKSGNIHQYAHLSQFSSVDQFNLTIHHFLYKNKDKLTKSEQIAFHQLTQFSVKVIGICNARICKLVEATHLEKKGVSRSTFERMLKKIVQLNLIKIYKTTREKGGTSHNVYVFQQIDGANCEKLTERKRAKKPILASEKRPEQQTEAILFKAKKQKEKDLRPIRLEELDYTFVPTYVPNTFTKTVKPFFDRATEICKLWDRTIIAYRSLRFTQPIEDLLPIIIKAFKETIYQYKRRKIKTTFIQYYYGTVAMMLTVEKRRMVARSGMGFNWLVD